MAVYCEGSYTVGYARSQGTSNTGYQGLDEADFHFHIGYNLPVWGTFLALWNRTQCSGGLTVHPSYVAKKWDFDNEWVFLHSCNVLSDVSGWGKALKYSHMIMGFSTTTYTSTELLDRFFRAAIEWDWDIYWAYYHATTETYKGYDSTIKAVIIADNSDQLYNDHLWGQGNVEPDEYPDDDKVVYMDLFWRWMIMSYLRVVVPLLLLVVIGTSAILLSDENPQPKPLSGDAKITLKAELPKVKVAAVYKIIDVERTLIPPKKNLRDVRYVPSESEAIRILNLFGYEGLVLKSVETVTTKVVNTGEIIEEKPEFVSIIYGREINGVPVVGPAADGIVAAVADGEVIYMSKLWRKIEKVGEKPIISSEEFTKLKNRELLNKPLYAGTKLEVREVKLAYYAGREDQRYYKIVWLFKCVDDLGNWVDIIVDAERL